MVDSKNTRIASYTPTITLLTGDCNKEVIYINFGIDVAMWRRENSLEAREHQLATY